MTVSHQVRALNLGQGSIQPIDFFVSPDGTLIYVLARDRSSVLIYDLSTSSTSGIQLAGNAAPVSVGMSADASSIVVAGSDGMLHQISTALGGTDTFQLAFPNLPDFLNPFCTFEPTSGPCTLDLISVKP